MVASPTFLGKYGNPERQCDWRIDTFLSECGSLAKADHHQLAIQRGFNLSRRATHPYLRRKDRDWIRICASISELLARELISIPPETERALLAFAGTNAGESKSIERVIGFPKTGSRGI